MVYCHCTLLLYTVNAVTVYSHRSWYTVFWHCTLSLHTAHCHSTLSLYTVTVHCHFTLYTVHHTPQGLIECVPRHSASATTAKSPH